MDNLRLLADIHPVSRPLIICRHAFRTASVRVLDSDESAPAMGGLPASEEFEGVAPWPVRSSRRGQPFASRTDSSQVISLVMNAMLTTTCRRPESLIRVGDDTARRATPRLWCRGVVGARNGRGSSLPSVTHAILIRSEIRPETMPSDLPRVSDGNPLHNIPRDLAPPPVVDSSGPRVGVAGQVLHVLQRHVLLQKVGHRRHPE
jgi:hypothetical protein